MNTWLDLRNVAQHLIMTDSVSATNELKTRSHKSKESKRMSLIMDCQDQGPNRHADQRSKGLCPWPHPITSGIGTLCTRWLKNFTNFFRSFKINIIISDISIHWHRSRIAIDGRGRFKIQRRSIINTMKRKCSTKNTERTVSFKYPFNRRNSRDYKRLCIVVRSFCIKLIGHNLKVIQYDHVHSLYLICSLHSISYNTKQIYGIIMFSRFYENDAGISWPFERLTSFS